MSLIALEKIRGAILNNSKEIDLSSCYLRTVPIELFQIPNLQILTESSTNWNNIKHTFIKKAILAKF